MKKFLVAKGKKRDTYISSFAAQGSFYVNCLQRPSFCVFNTFPFPFRTIQIFWELLYSTKKWNSVSNFCRLCLNGGIWTGRIEWFIETQALLRSYYLAPRPSLPPSFWVFHKQVVSLSLAVCLRSSLLTGKRAGGGGHGAKSYDRKKAWPSIYRSILSGVENQSF